MKEEHERAGFWSQIVTGCGRLYLELNLLPQARSETSKKGVRYSNSISRISKKKFSEELIWDSRSRQREKHVGKRLQNIKEK